MDGCVVFFVCLFCLSFCLSFVSCLVCFVLSACRLCAWTSWFPPVSFGVKVAEEKVSHVAISWKRVHI